MSEQSTQHANTMAGGGAYGQHSRIPAAGGGLAIPLLEEAAERITLDADDRPIVVADYGSADGRNSLAPMNAAIATLRRRVGAARPIAVCHTDLPGNDYSTLFKTIDGDVDGYARRDAMTFPYAIGRSFYRSVFPANHVNLGWSSYAAVWLSRLPHQIPDHIFISRCSGPIRAEFDRQAALDWETFLTLRAIEMRRGSRLVVALPSLDHDGSTAFTPLFDHAVGALVELVETGAITADERSRMTLGACPRRERDLLAPFKVSGEFRGLTVERVKTLVAPDSAWADYERDGDGEVLAAKRAMFFRVIFVPTLSLALSTTRSAGDRRMFADRLEEAMSRRIARAPARLDHLVGIIVVAKREAA
jgi:SAM dependent carboxyl methyltransferase